MEKQGPRRGIRRWGPCAAGGGGGAENAVHETGETTLSRASRDARAVQLRPIFRDHQRGMTVVRRPIVDTTASPLHKPHNEIPNHRRRIYFTKLRVGWKCHPIILTLFEQIDKKISEWSQQQ